MSTEQKYIEHALKSELLRFQDVQRRMMSMPICPRCERVALRDTRRGENPLDKNITCPMCHYHGKPSGVSFKMYVKSAMYK